MRVLVKEELVSAVEVIAKLVDVLRRSDAEYCGAHRGEPVSDEEWDTALAQAEDYLEDIEALMSEGGLSGNKEVPRK